MSCVLSVLAARVYLLCYYTRQYYLYRVMSVSRELAEHRAVQHHFFLNRYTRRATTGPKLARCGAGTPSQLPERELTTQAAGRMQSINDESPSFSMVSARPLGLGGALGVGAAAGAGVGDALGAAASARMDWM